MGNRFDLIIIGAGPGGYLAAERAGALGKKVLLIEKDSTLGGVCLNRGCIPTKSLLNSAKLYYNSLHSSQFGLKVLQAEYDHRQALDWKNKTVAKITKGVAWQMKRYNVEALQGHAKLADRETVEVNGNVYKADHIIIASGSSAAQLSIPGKELNHVLGSDELLELQDLPQKPVIIGAGVIGIEFASFFSLLGIPVTVLEMEQEILPGFDREIAILLRKAMKNTTFITGCKASEIDSKTITYLKDGEQKAIAADLVLIAAGRKPNVNGLGLEDVHLDFNSGGIAVNDRMQTNVPGIFAVGDVTGKSMLAHSAYRMAEVAVNVMFGKDDRMRYGAVPSVVYSYPEISSVGVTEEQAKKEGRRIKTAKLQLQANGRFVAEHGNQRGVCKIVIDAQTEALIGLSIIGGHNSEMIFGAAAMIEAEWRIHDIKEVIFPHPTVSEMIKDTLWEL